MEITPIFDRSEKIHTDESVSFQALSWYSADFEKYEPDPEEEPKKQYEIYVHGVNNLGQSVCLRILNFTPYFYVELPDEWSDMKIDKFYKTIKEKLWKKSYGLIDYNVVSRVKLYPYLAGKKFKFIRLIFSTDQAFTAAKWLFNKPLKVPGVEHREREYSVYESNVNHLNRFCHIREIETTGWITANKLIKTEPNGDDTFPGDHTNAQIYACTKWKNVFGPDTPNNPAMEQNSGIAPLTIFSWDIECLPGNTEKFPNPENNDDIIAQIGIVLAKYGTDHTQKIILTNRDCAPIDGVTIIQAETEKELLINFCELIKIIDPDILTGYNTWGFDDLYLWTRCSLHNVRTSHLTRISRIPAKLQKKELHSNAYGSNAWEYLLCPGRETLDLLVAIRRDHKLDSYRLDRVGEIFVNEKKDDLPYRELFEKLKNGTPEDVAICAKYCVQDSNLVVKIILKLSLIPNFVEMAKATYVPMEWLLFRGQQCKVFSLIVREARKYKYVVPVHKQDRNAVFKKFKGATVIEPMINFYYYPIAGLDFASLYPSIMIAYNMCYSTIITTPEMLEYVQKNNIPYETIEWTTDPSPDDEDDMVQKTVNHKYHFVQIEDKEGKEIENGTRGLLGIILDRLWKGRKETKKLMKSEKDPFKKEVLNGKQMAQKVTMNSIYGFTGAEKSGILPLKPIASSVTAKGREMIDQTAEWAEEEYGATTVYGDSIPPKELITVQSPTGALVRSIKNPIDISVESFANYILSSVPWEPYRGFKVGDRSIKNKECKDLDKYNKRKYTTLTHEGYKPIRKVIRHKTNKKLYKIRAKDSNGKIHEVTVTEGHSLIADDGSLVEAEQLKVGQMLKDYSI
jgi:DNA polymerase delta subunit 1